ncbi:unnamed protein product [Peronospora destructor]|uniref:RxLR effector protein n=1 Tax=Peronospora destructor TaxID=86335 RepID=A0AAV0USY2_9STRA|nr:unnamed protein product [Peronospora destructor]
MTKLNVILSFAAAVAMVFTSIDMVNAANIRSEGRFLTSIAIDSTKAERFLQEIEASEGAENDGSLSTDSNLIPQEAEKSENEEDDSVDSTDSERFLVEVNGGAAKVGERFNGERFLQEIEASEGAENDGSLSTDSNLIPQEAEKSENEEDDSVDSTDSERFLVEVNGGAAKVGERFNGERFLQEIEASEGAENDGSLSTDSNLIPQEAEKSENEEDDSVDSTDSERFLVEVNGGAAKVGERFNGERFLQEIEASEGAENDGSLSTDSNLIPQEAEKSETEEDDSSDSI